MIIKKYLCKVRLCAALFISGAAFDDNSLTLNIPDNTLGSYWKNQSLSEAC